MVDDEPRPQRKYLDAPPTRFLRKPYTVLVAAIALVAGMSLSAAAHETQAHPDDSQCESGEICLYDYNNQNGSGGIATYGGSDGDYGNDNYPYTSTDLDQSVNSYRNAATTARCTSETWTTSRGGPTPCTSTKS